ncbi:ExbD/TolR family protein [Planctomicrobium piriforme]|uniref:ExbD/TolR family protein n=1 Tax=Planctomicrobium piriforme TaxID=1576369 RepID=UPI001C318086|nr:biopolymer transporter ExbD [Planctomicrobium piriforme]
MPVDESAGSEQAEESQRGLSLVEETKDWLKQPAKNAWQLPAVKQQALAHQEEDDEEEAEFHIPRKHLPEGGLDMTPMVDVVMLLLIFFMITASFVTQKSLETSPPEADGEGIGQSETVQEAVDDSIVVRIDENNVISVEDVPVTGTSELIDVLNAKIASENKREMLIEVHPAALHGTVVSVMDAGLDVQMQRIRRTSTKAD